MHACGPVLGISSNILRVMVTCESRWSHSWAGYLGSVDQTPAIQLFLKVCMALSAIFQELISRETIWKRVFILGRVFFEDIKRLIFYYLELIILPAVISMPGSFWTPLLVHAPDIDGRVSVKIVLLS